MLGKSTKIEPQSSEIALWSFSRRIFGCGSEEERAKSAPRAPQERPRAPQERPRGSQERPKSVQEGPKTSLKALWGALGDYFDAPKLEKRAFRERSVA